MCHCQLYLPFQWRMFVLLPPKPPPCTPLGSQITHTLIQNLFKSDTHFYAQQSFSFYTYLDSLTRTHTYTYMHTHTHTHSSVPFQHHWQRDKQRIWEVRTASKKEEKQQNQPRPEIDKWRWQRFWQAEWSRSLYGFIQEEIRNTHRVWSVHYLSRDDPKINNNNGKISQ